MIRGSSVGDVISLEEEEEEEERGEILLSYRKVTQLKTGSSGFIFVIYFSDNVLMICRYSYNQRLSYITISLEMFEHEYVLSIK
jgi:hypothetical protein